MTKSRRHVFVTGGTGSVGQALVRAFVLSDYKVTFQFHSNETVARALEKECKAEAIQLNFELGELSLPESAVDVVVNNAGINIANELSHEISPDDWNRTLAVNITAPYLIIRRYLPAMCDNGWGRIINISSIYGLTGAENNLPYNVSKHGMAGLTKTIAREYGKRGITCNEICPGPISSELMERIGKKRAAIEGISMEEYYDEVKEEIPAGRLAEPSEVADLAVFFASPAAQYINGISIPLDGGMLA
ncbi:MAG: SDR family oxidoreductase [Planctomycetes bacterium]|nr:SDR family oxidoreductase [Planctomycetota bacterium]